MFINDEYDIGIGAMKIPTFYTAESDSENFGTRLICMSVVGGVFGGIHCVGWFFDFPSSAEAMMWRVSSVVLTSIAFGLPISFNSVGFLFPLFRSIIPGPLFGSIITSQKKYFTAGSTILLLVYVVSRLLLLVEAFISLRHLAPEMLALVKWTSFIPHI